MFSRKINPLIVFGVFVTLVLVKPFVIELGSNRTIDFFFSTLIFEFIGGYLLFYFSQYLSKTSYIWFLLFLAMISLVFGLCFNRGYGLTRVLTFGVFSFSIVWLFVVFENYNILIIQGVFKKIGDSSYTLYLSHTVLLYAFYKSGFRDYFVENNMPVFGFILILGFILLISYVFYRLIELPL